MTIGETPVATASAVVGAGLRALVTPTILVGLCVVVGCGLVRGLTGAVGGAVGVLVVVAFFGVTHAVLAGTRQLPPEFTLLIALGLYIGKVVLVALSFLLLDAGGLLGDPLDRVGLAVSVIVCTLTWTGAEIAAAMRSREPIYALAPPPSARSEDDTQP